MFSSYNNLIKQLLENFSDTQTYYVALPIESVSVSEKIKPQLKVASTILRHQINTSKNCLYKGTNYSTALNFFTSNIRNEFERFVLPKEFNRIFNDAIQEILKVKSVEGVWSVDFTVINYDMDWYHSLVISVTENIETLIKQKHSENPLSDLIDL